MVVIVYVLILLTAATCSRPAGKCEITAAQKGEPPGGPREFRRGDGMANQATAIRRLSFVLDSY
jgi:hypothetical protein